MIQTRGLEQREPFINSVQELKTVMIWIEDSARVWMKAQQSCGRVMSRSNFLELVQNGAMTCMHSVERSDGQNGAFDA